MNPRYRLIGPPLGRGGMATVYRAEATSAEGFSRPVAIKYIHEDLAALPTFEEQFRAEAQLISRLHHPNIVQVLDFDRDKEGRLFIAMELVEGTDLRRIRTQGPLPCALAVGVAAEVLKGLIHAHEARDEQGRSLGIVHRDLSPQNVLVSWDGAVKITDFGIAESTGEGGSTQTGLVKGNPGYMSPEQVNGMRLDARTDVYAVGVLLHELIAGEAAYAKLGRSTRSMLTAVLLGHAPALVDLGLEVPKPLSDYVLRLMAHDREARPATAREALSELLELELASSAAALELAVHVQPLRRAAERPTLLEGEPADVPPAQAEVVPVTAEISDPRVTPMPVAWEPLLPWVTVVLGLALLGLLGVLLYPIGGHHEPDPVSSPAANTGAQRNAQEAVPPAAEVAPVLVPAAVIELDAGVPVDAGRSRRRVRRAGRAARNRRSTVSDAGALKSAATAPALVPAESSLAPKDGGLAVKKPAEFFDYEPPDKPTDKGRPPEFFDYEPPRKP